MKHLIKTTAYILMAVSLASCAKAVSEGVNEDNVRYFKAWMEVNHPNIEPTGLGIYVLPTEATGKEKDVTVEKEGYVFADYTITDLEGNISSYTEADSAKKLGTYKETTYYGPKVISTIKVSIQAGVAEALVGMKAGERKRVIIPGWLMSYASYGTEAEYIKKNKSGSNTIYDITVHDFTKDIRKFEADSIKRFITDNPLFNESKSEPLKGEDTTFVFQPKMESPEPEEKFPSDTTIYINYTGRLLNGLVFDTTDEVIAKNNGLYSASKTYEPVEVTWGEKYSDIKLNGSSVIPGFALTLWEMPKYRKAVGVFSSNIGYSYNGSGSSIPAYSPLMFEIEIVPEPED